MAETFIRLIDRVRRMPLGPAFNPLEELGLTHSHLRAMYTLRREPGMPMKELAEELGMTPPSVTTLTRRLVELRLLQREADPNDSRRVLLTLTAEGATLLDSMHAAHVSRFEHLLGALSNEERAQFLDLMERAVVTLERTAGTPRQDQRFCPKELSDL
jgi:DNA-binding MarR family transcriptional regulator